MSYYGSPIKCSTGEKVEPKYWDFDKKRVRKNHPASAEINLLLDDLELKVTRAMYELRMSGRIISLQDIKETVRGILQNEVKTRKPVDFIEVYQLFMQTKNGLVKPLTMKKYKSFLQLVLDFQLYRKRKLSFDQITMEFQEHFKKYLLQKGLLNNTLNKYFDNLKAFMHWAEDMGYHKNTEYKQFKSPRDKTPVIHLTQEELEAIEQIELQENTALLRARDIFLFQCYTGQRYSDIQNLKWEDLKVVDQTIVWNLNQIKGNKTEQIHVPINHKAQEILKNYGFEDRSNKLIEKALPQLSGVRINKLIKEVCKRAGIEEQIKIQKYSGKEPIILRKPKYQLISSHSARRTFVTLNLERGIAPHIIMKITGHESFKTMRAYMNISDRMVREAM